MKNGILKNNNGFQAIRNLHDLDKPESKPIQVRFTWRLGPYIDVSTPSKGVGEVINVWDSRSDTPRIPATQEAFEQCVSDWLSDYGTMSLRHDILNNWN